MREGAHPQRCPARSALLRAGQARQRKVFLRRERQLLGCPPLDTAMTIASARRTSKRTRRLDAPCGGELCNWQFGNPWRREVSRASALAVSQALVSVGS